MVLMKGKIADENFLGGDNYDPHAAALFQQGIDEIEKAGYGYNRRAAASTMVVKR